MNNKTIKTKETVQSIKTKDKKTDFNHYVKKNTISEKEPIVNEKNDNKEETNGQIYAVNHVENIQKVTAISSTRKSKKYVQDKISKQRQKKKLQKTSETISSNTPIKTKENLKARLHQDRQKVIKTKSFENPTHNTSNKLKLKQPSNSKPLNYSSRMKSLMMLKHKNKVKKSREALTYTAKSSHLITKSVKGTFKAIGTATKTVSNLFSCGMALILLIIISLFMGVFACLSENGGINSEIQSLSPEVLAYEETIIWYAEQYNIKEYVPILEAIMMQESKGLGNDPMQSSESEFNTMYPRESNGITDPDYSIEVGVQTFSDCLAKAEIESPADTEKLYLALQGYNYGSGYIEWAINHFGGYTKANAKVYSDEKRAELQIESFGDPKYVSHVLRYYYLDNSNVVLVAKSQIGNIGGKPYWSWYGYDERVEWCAIFVSWCANQTGKLNVAIPKFAVVSEGISWYRDKGLFKTNAYIPKPGDLIFFDWENDGSPDHVGIVEMVQNSNIYTIEGNSNNECKENIYSLYNGSIYGYGMIKK